VPLHDFSVIMPYRTAHQPDEILRPLHIQAVASTPRAALATAEMIGATLAALQSPSGVTMAQESTKVGQSGRVIDGPYAYILTKGNRVLHYDFPARIDSEAGEAMGNLFTGLDVTNLFGVVMDCHTLTYINTSGLASLAAHARRTRLQLFRVSEPVRRVFEIVGLIHLLKIHASLADALAGLEKSYRADPLNTLK
jgi:anti-anti-sigma regulatory factor